MGYAAGLCCSGGLWTSPRIPEPGVSLLIWSRQYWSQPLTKLSLLSVVNFFFSHFALPCAFWFFLLLLSVCYRSAPHTARPSLPAWLHLALHGGLSFMRNSSQIPWQCLLRGCSAQAPQAGPETLNKLCVTDSSPLGLPSPPSFFSYDSFLSGLSLLPSSSPKAWLH